MFESDRKAKGGRMKYTMETALRKAREGYFEFQYDAVFGENFVRMQTPNGKWITRELVIVARKGNPVRDMDAAWKGARV